MVNPATFHEVVSVIRSRVDGVLAVATVASDGRIDDLVRVDPEFDQAMIEEFATLVRIADRIAMDASTGPLSAVTWKTEKATVLMNRVPPDRSILLFGTRNLQAGLARYLLARWATSVRSGEHPGEKSQRASS